MKQPKCKEEGCGEENPANFPKGKKNLCKKCKNKQQNEENQKKRELLKEIEAKKSKPETQGAPSSSPSPHNYETFQTAVNDLRKFIDKQAEEFQRVTQEFELYKINSEAKIETLESRIESQELISENVNTYVKNYINSLSLRILTLESKPVIIPVSTPSSVSSSSVSTPSPSPTPSPILSRSKSPVKENPVKANYKEIINLINDDLALVRKNKRPINYTLKELEALTREHKINRHGARNWDEVALAIIADLQNRINVC